MKCFMIGHEIQVNRIWSPHICIEPGWIDLDSVEWCRNKRSFSKM